MYRIIHAMADGSKAEMIFDKYQYVEPQTLKSGAVIGASFCCYDHDMKTGCYITDGHVSIFDASGVCVGEYPIGPASMLGQ